MSNNVIKEYLISLGVNINPKTGSKLNNFISGTDSKFKKLTTSVIKTGAAYTALATGITVFINSAAKSDMAMEKISRRMMMNKRTVTEYKFALDSLKESITDIELNPELMRRFNQLRGDSRSMQTPEDFGAQMKKIRDLGFEVTRFQHTLKYAALNTVYYLTKYLDKPLNKSLAGLRKGNKWFIDNMPKISNVAGKVMGKIGETYEANVKFFSKLGKKMKEFWDMLPPWARKAILGSGLLALLFMGASNPVALVTGAVAAVKLLIADYIGWQEGKESALGGVWKFLTDAINNSGNAIYAVELKFRNFVKVLGEYAKQVRQVGLYEATKKLISGEISQKIADEEDPHSQVASRTRSGLTQAQVEAQAEKRRRENKLNKEAQSKAPSKPVKKEATIDTFIHEAAKKYGLDPNELKAQIKAESGFNPRAVSPAGAAGLMQLMPKTAKDLEIKNVFDPRENIMGGAKYMRQLLDMFGGDRDKALAAYNWGMGNVSSGGAYPKETREYIARIRKYEKEIAASSQAQRQQASSKPAAKTKSINVKPLQQGNDKSCGQTSVAMAINSLTGKNLTDADISSKYGFGLIEALSAETKGIDWQDRNFSSSSWIDIEGSLAQGIPVPIGVGGEFTSSGYGHIMLITAINGDSVTLMDPATGDKRTVTKKRLQDAKGYAQGDFYFRGKRKVSATPPKTASTAKKVGFNSLFNPANSLLAHSGFSGMGQGAVSNNVNLGGIVVNVANSNASPQEIGNVVASAVGNRMASQLNFIALNASLNNSSLA